MLNQSEIEASLQLAVSEAINFHELDDQKMKKIKFLLEFFEKYSDIAKKYKLSPDRNTKLSDCDLKIIENFKKNLL